ncbi:MAG: response regulator [Gemmatimonadales bacterium]|jgi:DNA-binding NtrC family response regulator|nr:response regulator [Gemmatimonadales bacterium]
MMPLRILVADDDEDLRDLLAFALRADGYEMVEVADGTELIASVFDGQLQGRSASTLALIITDIRMPGRTGMEALASLRQAQVHTPVIVITGFGDAATLAEARRLGVAAVFDKPFDLDLLRAAVRDLLKRL